MSVAHELAKSIISTYCEIKSTDTAGKLLCRRQSEDSRKTGDKLRKINEKCRVCIYSEVNGVYMILVVNGPFICVKSDGNIDTINVYGLPGGTRESGETREEAAARELVEETGGLLAVTKHDKIFLLPQYNNTTTSDKVKTAGLIIKNNSKCIQKFNKNTKNTEYYFFVQLESIGGFRPNPGKSGEITYANFMKLSDVLSIANIKPCDKSAIDEYFSAISSQHSAE